MVKVGGQGGRASCSRFVFQNDGGFEVLRIGLPSRRECFTIFDEALESLRPRLADVAAVLVGEAGMSASRNGGAEHPSPAVSSGGVRHDG